MCLLEKNKCAKAAMVSSKTVSSYIASWDYASEELLQNKKHTCLQEDESKQIRIELTMLLQCKIDK